MLEIIALIFLCKRIGITARNKGLNPGQWKFFTVLTWLLFEFLGVFIGMLLFGHDQKDLLGIMAFAVACAFGGYLLIKAVLDRKPDPIDEDEINNIGAN